MGKNDRFIRQIEFYCDLWCERCPLSASCFQYSVVDLAEGFSDRQKKSILQMRKLWLNTARRLGVQVNPDEFFRIALARSRLLSVGRIRRVIRQARDLFIATHRFLIHLSQTMPPMHGDAERIGETLDEIHWFEYQVHFRVALAGIMGVWEKERPAIHFDQEVPRADGFAKSALASVERLESSLTALPDFNPDLEPAASRLAADLRRLKDGILEVFPSAPEFVRPGFDWDSAGGLAAVDDRS